MPGNYWRSLSKSLYRCRSSSLSDSEVIVIAAKCAKAVYDASTEPHVDKYIFDRLTYISPSLNGVTKGTALYTVYEDASRGVSNPLLPALIVSIKGTSRAIDWLVNLNSELRGVREHLGPPGLSSALPLPKELKAHSGFINGASALEAGIASYIRSVFKAGRIEHVIFTGHSAGGAVASLLFLRFLDVAAHECMHLLHSVPSPFRRFTY